MTRCSLSLQLATGLSVKVSMLKVNDGQRERTSDALGAGVGEAEGITTVSHILGRMM